MLLMNADCRACSEEMDKREIIVSTGMFNICHHSGFNIPFAYDRTTAFGSLFSRSVGCRKKTFSDSPRVWHFRHSCHGR